jgi:metal-responsive CopG/Arc/MetJ family transcriptional regulator
VNRTTVYLPDELKAAVERLAGERGTSEAEVIREAIRALATSERPTPTFPLFCSGDPTMSERVDELMKGFGED